MRKILFTILMSIGVGTSKLITEMVDTTDITLLVPPKTSSSLKSTSNTNSGSLEQSYLNPNYSNNFGSDKSGLVYSHNFDSNKNSNCYSHMGGSGNFISYSWYNQQSNNAHSISSSKKWSWSFYDTKSIPSPTAEPSVVPTYIPTAEPSVVPTAGPSVEPSAVSSVEPSAEPSAVPSAEPTPSPSAEPSAVPSAEPTPSPSAEPSAEPTPSPSAEPSAEPTAVPTAVPSDKPTPSPTAKPLYNAILMFDTGISLTGLSSPQVNQSVINLVIQSMGYTMNISTDYITWVKNIVLTRRLLKNKMSTQTSGFTVQVVNQVKIVLTGTFAQYSSNPIELYAGLTNSFVLSVSSGQFYEYMVNQSKLLNISGIENITISSPIVSEPNITYPYPTQPTKNNSNKQDLLNLLWLIVIPFVGTFGAGYFKIVSSGIDIYGLFNDKPKNQVELTEKDQQKVQDQEQPQDQPLQVQQIELTLQVQPPHIQLPALQFTTISQSTLQVQPQYLQLPALQFPTISQSTLQVQPKHVQLPSLQFPTISQSTLLERPPLIEQHPLFAQHTFLSQSQPQPQPQQNVPIFAQHPLLTQPTLLTQPPSIEQHPLFTQHTFLSQPPLLAQPNQLNQQVHPNNRV